MTSPHPSWGSLRRVAREHFVETVVNLLETTPSARVYVIVDGGLCQWRRLLKEIVNDVRSDAALEKQLVRLNEDELWLMPRTDEPQDVRRLTWLRMDMVWQHRSRRNRFWGDLASFIPNESILVELAPVVDAIAQN